MAAGAASSGSGTARQRALASSGRMKVTRVPRLGPWQRSPCHARGFRSVPQPERSASPTWRRPRFALTAVTSSSRVSGPASSAARTALWSASICFGVTPK
jgi:hypothetical protein